MTKVEHDELLAETKAVMLGGKYLLRLSDICARVPDNWALCELGRSLNMTKNAFEAEMLIAQTIHAAMLNRETNGVPYSFRAGPIMDDWSGLNNSGTAYGFLLNNGFFVEEQLDLSEVKKPPKNVIADRDGKYTVIYITNKLLIELETFFLTKTAKT